MHIYSHIYSHIYKYVNENTYLNQVNIPEYWSQDSDTHNGQIPLQNAVLI